MRLDAMTMATTIIKKFSILATATMFLLGFNILIMISTFAMAATTHSDHSLDCSTPCPQSVVLKEDKNLPDIKNDDVLEPTPKSTLAINYNVLLKDYSYGSFSYNADNKVPLHIRNGLMRL